VSDATGEDVLRFEPDAEGDPSQLAHTFGGFEPLVSVGPGTTIDVRVVARHMSGMC
jgi:hypothetical protein